MKPPRNFVCVMSEANGNPKIEYMCGFGNHFSSEAIAGALPVGQNSPQKCPFGELYVLPPLLYLCIFQ